MCVQIAGTLTQTRTRRETVMKTRIILTVALSIFAIGLVGCNMGPGPDIEMDMEMGEEYADVESEVTYVDPPACETVRHYLRWACVDGSWDYVPSDDNFIQYIDCDGRTSPNGVVMTDCYQEFYLGQNQEDCGNGIEPPNGTCSGNQIICPPHPGYRCRPVFNPPTEFARIR
jgi:hypothetical protein